MLISLKGHLLLLFDPLALLFLLFQNFYLCVDIDGLLYFVQNIFNCQSLFCDAFMVN